MTGCRATCTPSRIPPAIILLDMQMPAGGGMSMLEKMRGIPRLSRIPIVIVTANTDESLVDEVKSKGAVGVLHKPVDRDTLVDLVNSILEDEAKPA